MNLKSLMLDTKSAWIDFPGCRGFEIEVVNLSRKELTKLRKKCTITKFDRGTRQPVEQLDDEKFVAEFAASAIKDWKGLKLKYLEELLIVDLEGKDLEEELPYSKEDAELLVASSRVFDEFINNAVFDLENFRTRTEGATLE